MAQWIMELDAGGCVPDRQSLVAKTVESGRKKIHKVVTSLTHCGMFVYTHTHIDPKNFKYNLMLTRHVGEQL